MAKGDIRKALGILLVGSVIVSACTDKSAETTDSSQTQETKIVKESPLAWKSKSVTDKMTGKITRYKEIRSINKVDMKFPYNGGSLSEIMVVEHGGVRIDITKGQVLCSSWDGCIVKVKFDDGPVLEMRGVGPDNGQSGYLWLENHPSQISQSSVRFIKGLQTAKRVMISLEVFQEDWPVWEFDVLGFQKS